MSEENNNGTPEYLVDETSGEKYIQLEDGLRIYRAGFTGAMKGLEYHYPQFSTSTSDEATEEEKNKEAAAALAGAIKKYGADKILYLFNTALGNNVATKIRNSRIPLVKDDDEENKRIIANLVTKDPLRFSVEDAVNFQPGEREISYAGWLNKAKEAGKKGNRELAIKYGKKAFDVLMRDQVIMEDAAA